LDSASSRRREVIAARRAMLKQVETYSSRDITAALNVTDHNPSRRAAELREAERLFGVQLGSKWRYPKFQFDVARRLYAELPAILRTLPDSEGWDRLQWFLTPHGLLQGRTPLEVWNSSNRNRVVAAARAGYRRPRANGQRPAIA
jgi:hypothetical protein